MEPAVTWYLIGALLIVGLWGLLSKPNLIKKVIALSIANSAVVIMFVYLGSLSGTTAPIVDDGQWGQLAGELGGQLDGKPGGEPQGELGGQLDGQEGGAPTDAPMPATATSLATDAPEQAMVDPLPQALMLTAIVVGICVVALALVLVYRLYLIHGTLDIRKIERNTWGHKAGASDG